MEKVKPPGALQTTRMHVVKHKWGLTNIAAYSALIIFGANLLIEHGELKADVGYCEETVAELAEESVKYELKWEQCVESHAP